MSLKASKRNSSRMTPKKPPPPPSKKASEAKKRQKVPTLRVNFSDDDTVDHFLDTKKKSRKSLAANVVDEAIDVDKDEAVDFCGKYRGALERLERRRGDLKGSQVFGFKTPSVKSKQPRIITVNKKGNANAYFEAHANHIETSDKTLSQLKTPKLSQEVIDDLLANEPMQYHRRIEVLLQDYRSKFDKWLRLLHEDFSIVLFGFGSKKSLLQDFHSSKLSGCDCVVINGFFPSLTVKQVLNSITEDILDTEDSFNGVPEQVAYIASEMDHREDHLYLCVNNIDGPMLRNEKAQAVLAQLSSHPKIHLICSIDHINAPLVWDHHKLSKFNFIWFDTTTFLPYREETRYENSFMVTQSGALELNSLIHVFASLNQNAKGIYLKIVRHQIDATEDEDEKGYGGISFPELYQKCRAAFLVNSDLTLRAQMTEYKDHKLIVIKKGTDGIDYLTIPLRNNILQEFLELQNS